MKKMLVTYNQIPGVPLGRFEVGNLIVYSGDYGLSKYAKVIFSSPRTSEETRNIVDSAMVAADQVVSGLGSDLAIDLDRVDEVYIYVGAVGMRGAMSLCKDLVSAGKNVHMIACLCDMTGKIEFAKKLSITNPIIEAECGGRKVCEVLVNRLSRAPRSRSVGSN